MSRDNSEEEEEVVRPPSPLYLLDGEWEERLLYAVAARLVPVLVSCGGKATAVHI